MFMCNLSQFCSYSESIYLLGMGDIGILDITIIVKQNITIIVIIVLSKYLH